MLQLRVRGEDARRERQPAERSRSAEVRSSQQASRDEGRGDEVEGDGEAGAGAAGQAATAAPSPLAARREGAGRQRPVGGEELHRLGAARDRRHAGDGRRARRPARRRPPRAGSRVTADPAAERRQHRLEHPLGARRERVRARPTKTVSVRAAVIGASHVSPSARRRARDDLLRHRARVEQAGQRVVAASSRPSTLVAAERAITTRARCAGAAISSERQRHVLGGRRST